MPQPLGWFGEDILDMTWHRVSFTPAGHYFSRLKQQQACIKWCMDNISSADLLWKYVCVGEEDYSGRFDRSTGVFYFAHADQAVLFRLSMGV